MVKTGKPTKPMGLMEAHGLTILPFVVLGLGSLIFGKIMGTPGPLAADILRDPVQTPTERTIADKPGAKPNGANTPEQRMLDSVRQAMQKARPHPVQQQKGDGRLMPIGGRLQF